MLTKMEAEALILLKKAAGAFHAEWCSDGWDDPHDCAAKEIRDFLYIYEPTESGLSREQIDVGDFA